jgi:hypothetical protein
MKCAGRPGSMEDAASFSNKNFGVKRSNSASLYVEGCLLFLIYGAPVSKQTKSCHVLCAPVTSPFFDGACLIIVPPHPRMT